MSKHAIHSNDQFKVACFPCLALAVLNLASKCSPSWPTSFLYRPNYFSFPFSISFTKFSNCSCLIQGSSTPKVQQYSSYPFLFLICRSLGFGPLLYNYKSPSFLPLLLQERGKSWFCQHLPPPSPVQNLHTNRTATRQRWAVTHIVNHGLLYNSVTCAFLRRKPFLPIYKDMNFTYISNNLSSYENRAPRGPLFVSVCTVPFHTEWQDDWLVPYSSHQHSQDQWRFPNSNFISLKAKHLRALVASIKLPSYHVSPNFPQVILFLS